jgi:hypothetical protein
MAETHCPLCYGPLEVRDVAPCYDCGHDSKELDHLAEGRHTYAEMRVFGINIILCSFCQVDFSSYAASYFGRSQRVGLGRGMVFVRDVTATSPAKDKFCPTCGHRLAFLRFLAEARAAAPQ